MFLRLVKKSLQLFFYSVYHLIFLIDYPFYSLDLSNQSKTELDQCKKCCYDCKTIF